MKRLLSGQTRDDGGPSWGWGAGWVDGPWRISGWRLTCPSGLWGEAGGRGMYGLEGMLGGHSGRRGYHHLLSGLPGSHPWTMAPPPGSTPSRTGGFLGTTSPGPMAELYGAANQDSGVSSYISAASPAPSTGFGHSLGVSGWTWRTLKLKEGEALSVCGDRREARDDGWRECHQPRNSEGYHSVIQWTFNNLLLYARH